MDASDDVAEEYGRLRRLAVGDPRQAREWLIRMVTQQNDRVRRVMEMASRPGEGRVRQIIATTIRINATVRSVLRPWLDEWVAVESDEFALRAMRDVIEGEQHQPVPVAPLPAELPRHFPETYRYVSERLCHLVRNALALPDTELRRLGQAMRLVKDENVRAALTDILSGLRTGFQRVARAVEFDLGDGHVAWASIHLAEWLRRTTVDYGQRFGAARLTVRGGAEAWARVWAAPFLLENVFGNLWMNAVQAAGTGCELVIEITAVRPTLEVLIVDSGPGFDEAARTAVFQSQYSTKGTGGGRGLLEISEAVGRLQGKVQLAPVGPVSFRILLVFPLEGA